MAADLRATLEEIAAGRGPRPRGHAVTQSEFDSAQAIAVACDALITHTIETNFNATMDLEDEGDYIRDGGYEPVETALPPSGLLPPLP